MGANMRRYLYIYKVLKVQQKIIFRLLNLKKRFIQNIFFDRLL